MKPTTSTYISAYKSLLYDLALILSPTLVGLLAALLTRGNMNIFDTLIKPPFTPPRAVFPIAWTILYLLMGISLALAVHQTINKSMCTILILVFAIQLFFNFCWSILFFNFREFFLAFACLIIMLIFTIRSAILFITSSPLASFLLVPYILWTIFAGYLNFAIAVLN